MMMQTKKPAANPLMEIAERIREMREIVGYSEAEMAEKTEVSVEQYHSYEQGTVDFPFTFMHKCALAFGVELTDLLEGQSAKLSSYTVTRRGMGPVTASEDGITIQNMAAMFRQKLATPYWVTYQYSKELQSQPIHTTTHAGQEFDLVVKGTLREISACLILQAQSQLKALYKDNADTIIGNMDSRLFLGGSEPTTLKELSTALGKETIDTFNTGESRGRETSHSLNYQKLGKELASVDELAVLDGGKCILQLRGVRPFLSEKYDITKHPNYKYLSDADRRNTFDIEKFLSTKLKVKPEETYDSYEAAVTEELSSV